MYIIPENISNVNQKANVFFLVDEDRATLGSDLSASASNPSTGESTLALTLYGGNLPQALVDTSGGGVVESDKPNVPSINEFCNVDSYSGEDSVLQFINRQISASEFLKREALIDSYFEFVNSHISLSDSEREFYISIFKAFIKAEAMDKAVSVLTCGTKVSTMECEHCGYEHPVSYNCKLRICPRCARVRASELVEKYQPYLESQDPKRIRCITLTMKNVKCLLAGVSKIRRAFIKLLHRKYYKKLIDGGLYHIEVTVSNDGLWHIHIHCIVVGEYIPQVTLSKDWQDVTRDKDNKTDEGSPVVWIEQKEVKATLKYCMKHLLKKMKLNDNWTPEKLVEYEMALTDVRLVQPFGCFLGVLKDYKKKPFECPKCGWVLWKITDESGKVVKSSLGSMLWDYRKNKSP